LGAFLPKRSSIIDPSAKRNTTPTRQMEAPINAQIIWMNVGGRKTLIRYNPVIAATMVTTPPSFSIVSIFFNIAHLPNPASTTIVELEYSPAKNWVQS
jgi:hypothetical protein